MPGRLIAAALIAFCAAAGALAQVAGPGSTTAGPAGQARARQAQPDDREFLSEAARGGLAQVLAGRLALAKAADAEVRQYAQRLIDDHARANARLQELARRKGMAMPDQPSVLQKRRLRLLETARGGEFDRRFVDEFGVGAHQSAIWAFREQARDGSDRDLRVFAQRRLAALQKHLQRARLIQAGIGAPARGGGAAPAGGYELAPDPRQPR